MARRTPTAAYKSGLAALAAGIALLVTAVFLPAASAAPTPTPYEGNLVCQAPTFKIDAQPVNGVYHAPGGIDFTISGVEVDAVTKRVYFDWSATQPGEGGTRVPLLVRTVLVKFADGGLRYDYAAPGVSADVDLYSTQDSISHVDFCWDAAVTTTTTEGPTTTTTQGSTTTTLATTTTTAAPTTTTTAAAPTTTTVATTQTSEPTTETTTLVAPTAIVPTTPTEQVAGVVVQRQLPRTGLAVWPLTQLGSALIVLGVALLAYERRSVLVRS